MTTQLVELEIPARPEFVSIARMAVSALASLRPGLPYERVDDLRIVVSEACTAAIEATTGGAQALTRLRIVCVDESDRLEIRIDAPEGAFDAAVGREAVEDDFRFSLIRALVDEAEIAPSAVGSELCLVLKRDPTAVDDPGFI